MKNILWVGSILVILAAFMGNAQASMVVLDQQNVQFDVAVTSSSGNQYAQTFTVGEEGVLSSIEINFFWHPSDASFDQIKVEVLPTVNGVPALYDYQALARIDLTRGDLPLFNYDYWELLTPPYFSIDLSTFNINVSEGDVLAVAIDAPVGGLDYLSNTQDSYLSGAAYRRNR